MEQLSRGDSGQRVVRLQKKLTALGYYDGAIDGHFGPLTDQAVKQFQRANGLDVDGYVGPKTKAALYGGSSAGSGEPFTFGGGLLDKVIGGVLLYGVFKVLMKIF